MTALATISWVVDTQRELLGIPVYPHGLLIAVGFLAGSWLLLRYARRDGLPVDLIGDGLTWVAIASLVGTRLFWAIGNPSQLDSPLEVLMVWHGGMTLYGGIAGGLAAGVLFLRRHRLPVLRVLDLAAPGLALGLVLGRISDLIIGDHLGRPTGLPWGFRYVGDDPPGVAPPIGAVVHPVALYDTLLVTVLFVVLVLFLRRPRAHGSAAALFALWYASDRLLLDFLRTDPTRAFGLTGTQLASLGVLVVTTAWLLRRRGHRPLPTPVGATPAGAAPAA